MATDTQLISDLPIPPGEYLQEVFDELGVTGLIPPIPLLSNDGRYLALTGSQGSVLWTLDPVLWRDLACDRAGRNMTPTEWSAVVGDETYRATCDEWPAGL